MDKKKGTFLSFGVPGVLIDSGHLSAHSVHFSLTFCHDC